MKRYLFFTIGNRDLQGTYEISVGKRRKPIKVAELDPQEQDSISVYLSESFKEPKRDERLERQYRTGITFPIFCRTLEYLHEKRITRIDGLFLIATNRSKVLPKLEEIKNAWNANIEEIEKDPKWVELADYLEDGILYHARNDATSITAHFMQRRIKANNIPMLGISIDNVWVLDLGLYGSFDPILKLDSGKKAGVEVLGKADINTLDFFEYELYEALKPHFGSLENSRIYLGTHSGGMPMMQRALDNVLQSAVNYATYERIFTSEYLSYQIDNRLQGRFLTWLKKMNDNVLRLDLGTALYYCERIQNSNQGRADSDHFDRLNALIRKAMNYSASRAGWFEGFAALIFRGLYSMNMNEVIVWMKSMAESSYMKLLKDQQGVLWEKIQVEDKRVIHFPNAQGKKEDTSIHLFILIRKVDEEKLRKAFEDYISLFVNPNTLEDSLEWQRLGNIRNDLLHKGRPVYPKDTQDLLTFMRINPKDIARAIANLQDNNLDKIIEFESACLTNDFFVPLARIAGFTGTILQERKWSQRFFEALHRTATED